MNASADGGLMGQVVATTFPFLPDLFALFVLFLTSRKTPDTESLRERVYAEIPIGDDSERQTRCTRIVQHVLYRQFYSFSFFVPGFVAITAFLSAIAERGLNPWVAFTSIGIVLMFASDIYWSVYVNRGNLDKAKRCHKLTVGLLILLAIIGKILA